MRRFLNLIRNISNWWVIYVEKYSRIKSERYEIQTRSGVKVEVPHQLFYTFKENFMDQCYMRGMEHRNLSNPVILDIGANGGYFTLFAASRFPNARIIAFEPVPVNYRQLERNRKLNPQCRIETYPFAVAGQSGEIELTLDLQDAFTTSASVFNSNENRNLDHIKVKCKSLADIFKEQNIEKCDLLKMDCEGAEYDILYNAPDAIFSRIRQFAMEVHPGQKPGQNITSLEAFLRNKGFHTRQGFGLFWAWKN